MLIGGRKGTIPRPLSGLGQNSTTLNTLHAAGHIASRSWATFWGRTGATESTQSDGSFILGGFDRAKSSGQNYTDSLSYSNSECSSGILVTVTDITVDFANGTKANLFDGILSSAMSACVVLDYPALMTLPYNPYFIRFQKLTTTGSTSRTYGIQYYNILLPYPSRAYVPTRIICRE